MGMKMQLKMLAYERIIPKTGRKDYKRNLKNAIQHRMTPATTVQTPYPRPWKLVIMISNIFGTPLTPIRKKLSFLEKLVSLRNQFGYTFSRFCKVILAIKFHQDRYEKRRNWVNNRKTCGIRSNTRPTHWRIFAEFLRLERCKRMHIL